ncbi:MAG: hypothetical protein AAF530_24760, partial [Pseudomonadota bacterium]
MREATHFLGDPPKGAGEATGHQLSEKNTPLLLAGVLALCLAAPLAFSPSQAQAQLVDRTQAPNPADEGIALSLEEQVGAGQGDEFTP